MPFLIHLLKRLVGFLKYPEIDTLSTETGMSFEAEAVFLGNSLINFRTSFAEKSSTELLPSIKFF